MGLHRDGTIFGLKPELRRRLWWQICILDHRSSEYHGYEPLNINDSDLLLDMVEAPAERDEVSDMTLSLIRWEAMRTSWKFGRVPLGTTRIPGRAADSGLSLKDCEALIQELEQRLQEKYLRHCDISAEDKSRQR